MVRISVLNDALKNIYNAEKVGKRQASTLFEPPIDVSPLPPAFLSLADEPSAFSWTLRRISVHLYAPSHRSVLLERTGAPRQRMADGRTPREESSERSCLPAVAPHTALLETAGRSPTTPRAPSHRSVLLERAETASTVPMAVCTRSAPACRVALRYPTAPPPVRPDQLVVHSRCASDPGPHHPAWRELPSGVVPEMVPLPRDGSLPRQCTPVRGC